jgi:hypothetical protein
MNTIKIKVPVAPSSNFIFSGEPEVSIATKISGVNDREVIVITIATESIELEQTHVKAFFEALNLANKLLWS